MCVCVCLYVSMYALRPAHRTRLIQGGSESEQKFHLVVVEAQIYLAKLITAYIRRYFSE